MHKTKVKQNAMVKPGTSGGGWTAAAFPVGGRSGSGAMSFSPATAGMDGRDKSWERYRDSRLKSFVAKR
jgi:hypothetical protein